MGKVERELMNLEYSAYDDVVDFREKLLKRHMEVEEVRVSVGFHYDEDGFPVLDVEGYDGSRTYIDSYTLENLSRETFEEAGYELWVSAFEEDFDIAGVLEEYDNGRFRD